MILGGNFEAAVAAELADNEQIQAWSRCFDPVFTTRRDSQNRPYQVCQRVVPYRLAVTNLNVRTFRFETTRQRIGILKWRKVELPKVAFRMSISLSDVVAVSLDSGPLDLRVGNVLRRQYGLPRTGRAWDLRLVHAGGVITSSSVDEGISDVTRTIDDLLAGRALAEVQGTAADALERLGALRAAGVIDGGEFAAAKQALLGARPNQAVQALSSIRQLADMETAGTLTPGVVKMALAEQLARLERRS